MGLGGSLKVIPSTGPVSDEVQEIRMTESDEGYAPKEFRIKANMKTRWIVDAKNPYSCASQLTAPSIGVSKQLQQGENVIEFVSPAGETIRFSCSMGMYPGKIIVDAAGSDTNASPESEDAENPAASAGSGSSCSTGTKTE